MSIAAAPGLSERLPAAGAAAAEWSLPDRRRVLQLALAALWLLDGVLQLQPFMFTSAFGSQLLAAAAHGNPGPVAASVTWVSHQIASHPGVANTVFAFLQLGVGLGIAWRRTLRIALATSIGWALAVWWFGEGLGGLAAGTASPLTGAPGAALLYALLAVLLWPPSADEAVVGTAVVRRPLGATGAAAAWMVLWGGLGWTALWPANRAPGALARQIVIAGSMAPGWAGALDRSVAGGLAGHDLAAAIGIAVVCWAVGLAVLAPAAVFRPFLAVAAALAIAIWVVGESFGGITMGQAPDPNTGPLLVLLAAAYWPVRLGRRVTARPPALAGGGETA